MCRSIDKAMDSVEFLVEDLKQAAKECKPVDALLYHKLIDQAVDLRNGVALAKGGVGGINGEREYVSTRMLGCLTERNEMNWRDVDLFEEPEYAPRNC